MKIPADKKLILIGGVILLLIATGTGIIIGRSNNERSNATTATSEEKQLWTCGMHPWIVTEAPGQCPICGMTLVPKVDNSTAKNGDKKRKIAFWRAPMEPTEVYNHPGKSKMGMDLVPVYEDQVAGGVEIKINPVTRQNMGLRTARAKTAPLVRTIRTYGHITYDETRTYRLSPKVSGWIEKVTVDFTGAMVKKGELLAEIYSPQLLTAEEELLGSSGEMKKAARSRLLYWDVPEETIRDLEKSGRVSKTIPLRSPYTGVVTSTRAVAGAAIRPGQILYAISDLSRVWVEAHIFEYELPWIKMGQTAKMTLPYQPGTAFTGKVSYIYPYLQKKTRDVVIRIEFKNPGLVLKPDMYADIEIKSDPGRSGTVVPSEAILRSGTENLVFVVGDNDNFIPRKVTLGVNIEGDRVEIKNGIAPGEKVVISGQFLLDSESKLKEAVAKMLAPKKEKKAAPATKIAPATKNGDDFFDDM